MELKKSPFIIMLLAFIVSGISTSVLAQQTKQSQISDLVRALGYGGAIHNFKNYVLRGHEKYRENADLKLKSASEIVTSLQQMNLTSDEATALENIAQMIAAYQASLAAVQEQLAGNAGVEEIAASESETIKVDDGPALAGLATLRADLQWNDVEEIEYALGYGGAIHNFKNFLLRGAEKYETNAESAFERAWALSERLGEMGLNDAERTALTNLQNTIQAYQKSLTIVQKTAKYIQKTTTKAVIGMAIHSADKKVKVDDGPALAGLAVLGEKYKQ